MLPVLLAVIFQVEVAYKVGESIWRMKAQEIRKNPPKLDYVPVGTTNDFRRAKIENGRKVGNSFGDEANYFRKKKGRQKNPRFHYYNKNGRVERRRYCAPNEKEMEKMQLNEFK